jgi:hypothetical protein
MAEPARDTAAKAPLDEVMLAMDVVDTLRHRQRLVAVELDSEHREHQLKDRLRKIYAAQGIEVSDSVLEQGVAALKADRFVYRPPEGGLAVRLAHAYVARGSWGKWLAAGLIAIALASGVYYLLVVVPRVQLPAELREAHASVMKVAKTEEARTQATGYWERAQVALQGDDTRGAQSALRALEDLNETLRSAYTLTIASRPGERSGIWRIPDANTGARNYYIIVEAVADDGRPQAVPVVNEETGETERVSKWAVRVDEAVFRRILADKGDDGIIQNNRFGMKEAGRMKPEYLFPVQGGAITQW